MEESHGDAELVVSSRAASHPHGPGNGAAPLVRQGAHRVRRSMEPDHSHQGWGRGREPRDDVHGEDPEYSPFPGVLPAVRRGRRRAGGAARVSLGPSAAGLGAAAHLGAQDRGVPFRSDP